MTDRTWVPGYEVTFTVGGSDLSLSASQVSVADGQTPLAKPRFGTAHQSAIGGQGSGSFNASGHGSVEDMPTLAALRASIAGAPVAVTVDYGIDTGPADAGDDAFDCVIGQVVFDASADGELEWSLSGVISDPVAYTAPA